MRIGPMLPPHDLGAEEIVLSAVLWGDRTACELQLRPRWFWCPEYKQLWAVLLTLEELGCERREWGRRRSDSAEVRAVPDQALIAAVLGKPPCEQQHQITLRRLREIMHAAPLRGTVEDYARRIRERHRERQLIQVMQRAEAMLRAGERPPAKLLEWTARRLREMA